MYRECPSHLPPRWKRSLDRPTDRQKIPGPSGLGFIEVVLVGDQPLG
jgi:hypothetical protein